MRTSSISAIRTLGWPAWGASLLLFAALCAIAAYWAAVLLAPRAPIAPTGVVADPRALPELQQSAQLFGLSRAVVVAAKLSNVEVVGIVAAGRRGSAILGIDGKPPRAFAVGESLTASQRLSAVESDRVVIANNGQLVELPVPTNSSLDVLNSGADQPTRPGAPASAAPPPDMPQALVPVPGAFGLARPPPGATLQPPGSRSPGRIPTVPSRAPSSDIVQLPSDQQNQPDPAAPVLQKPNE